MDSVFGRVMGRSAEIAARFPWYGSLLAAHVDGNGQPPLMQAAALEKHYYASPPGPASPFAFAVYTTSGTSSGKRKQIGYSAEDEQRYIAIKAQLFREWLDSGEDGDGPVRTALADMGTGHAAGTAADVFETIGISCESLSFRLPIESHIEKLGACKPDLLYTMPSILDRIVRAAGQPDRFGIRKLILVGEIATPAWQRNIARKLGIAETDILDTYGSIEIGTIAAYSSTIGRYVIADGLHAECVGAEELGESFEPLPDDEKVLVLTSFVRDAFPAVRYVTYDVVRDFRTIRIDGHERQTFAGIVKRIGPELKHGEKISLYDIEEAVLRYAGDAVIRVVVNDRKLKVILQSGTIVAAQLPAIRSEIEEQIADIGAMIRGGLLEGIEVALSADRSMTSDSGVKSRKIHYGEVGTP